VLVRVRNNRGGENAILDCRDGQADAIDRDRSFINQIAIETFRNADAQPPVAVAQPLEREQLAGSIHVALDDVAA